jgi:hypothetical protein
MLFNLNIVFGIDLRDFLARVTNVFNIFFVYAH